MSRAIVTGSTGMLGVATIEVLLKEGYEVIAIARPGSSRLMNIPEDDNVTVVELDLADIADLPEVLNASGIEDADLFFHFSWDGTHGASRDDMDIQLANIKASVDAVRAAAALKCKTFLGAGSQAECGILKDGAKVAPDTPCFPVNGYGIGKLAAGQMTRVEAKKLGLRIIAHDITDCEMNRTRFVCIARDLQVSPEADAISVMLKIPHTEGSLYRLLTKFYVNGMNLLRIESRPVKDGSFDVMFYLDFSGRIDDANVKAVMNDLAKNLEYFRFLGTFKS